MMLETNKNYFSDNREILKSIPDKSINLFLEDMPYNTTACDWEYEVDLKEYWELRLPKLADNGVFVLTGSQPFTSELVLSNKKMFLYEWIWYKSRGANFFNLKNRPLKTQEQVLIFSKNSDINFNPIRVYRTESSLQRDPIGKERNYISPNKNIVSHYNKITTPKCNYESDGKKHPIDVLNFPIVEKGVYEYKHPTKKPIELFSYFIRTYTNENDIVFDGYSGSGTTAIACIRNNRQYIICENKKEYFDLQTKRILEEIDKTSLFNSLGGRQDRISA